MKKNSYDPKFISKNKSLIVEQSKKNAKRLQLAAQLLIDHGFYATATGRLVEGLEEVAKAGMIENNKTAKLSDLIHHETKAIEILQISAQQYGIPRTQIPQERIDWAQKRIPQMREDSTYTRLISTKGNQLSPDDKYWEKRAKRFNRFLKDVISKYEDAKRSE